jgi:YHS domain-containing protein
VRILTRLLLLCIVVLLVGRALGRLLKGIIDGAKLPPQPSRQGPPAPREVMSRDPVCGTFVLPSRAFAAKDRTGVYYFCSEACRDGWVRGAETPQAARPK